MLLRLEIFVSVGLPDEKFWGRLDVSHGNPMSGDRSTRPHFQSFFFKWKLLRKSQNYKMSTTYTGDFSKKMTYLIDFSVRINVSRNIGTDVLLFNFWPKFFCKSFNWKILHCLQAKPGLHWQLWEAISGSNATKNPKVASQNCWGVYTQKLVFSLLFSAIDLNIVIFWNQWLQKFPNFTSLQRNS